MNTAVANIQEAYASENLSDTRRNRVKANVSEIHIVTEEEAMDCIADGNGKFILSFDYTYNANTVRAVFSYYTNDGRPLAVE